MKRLEIGPFNTLALAEYDNEKQAKAAMKNLAYYKFNYLMPLYLEYAPLQISKDRARKEEAPAEVEDDVTKEEDSSHKQERTVFVKNLNFSTTEEMLEQVFKETKEAGKPLRMISCKIVRNTKT